MLLLVPVFIWRMTYYGEWLPNTVYVKVDPDKSAIIQGYDYLFYYLRDFAPLFCSVFLDPHQHAHGDVRGTYFHGLH